MFLKLAALKIICFLIMHIGLYFGSFNPIHVGHLIVANCVLTNTDTDTVWFVVSPQNPLKLGCQLLNEHIRLRLVEKAINGDNRLKACDVEFALSKPSYTINTLEHLSLENPEHMFSIIMGSDSYLSLPQWKNYEQLERQYNFIIYPRMHAPLTNKIMPPNSRILNAPMLDISATYIRENVQQKKSIRYLVPDAVRQEIEQNRYYL